MLLVGDGAVYVDLANRRGALLRTPVVAGWIETYVGREEVVLETRSGTLVRAAVEDPRRRREILLAAGVAPEQRAITLRLGADPDAGARAFFVFLAMVLAPVVAMLALLTFLSVFSWSAGVLVLGGITAFLGLGLWLVLRPLVSTTPPRGHRRRCDPAPFQEVLRPPRQHPRRPDAGAPGRHRPRHRPRALHQRPWPHRGRRGCPAHPRSARRWARRTPRRSPLDRLERNGRDAAEWLRDLRALTSKAGGYREATIEARALLEVVEDGAAPPERRIAAAAALSGTPEPEARARVRVAAEACVDDRLREAMRWRGRGISRRRWWRRSGRAGGGEAKSVTSDACAGPARDARRGAHVGASAPLATSFSRAPPRATVVP